MQKLNLRRERIALALGAAFVSIFTPVSFIFAGTAAVVNSPFAYSFSVDGTLREGSSISDTSSPYWWVNSGGKLSLSGGVGKTAHASLATSDAWRILYNKNNPLDTDSGYHPQNLFRLVSRSSWENAHVESQYKIDADNFSSSPNRNASNGLLLMSRYHLGGQTLYYFGIRVDGTAVIKKKYNGTYYMLAQKAVFPGTYAAGGKVNLLPHGQWVTLGADTVTNANGSVTLRLWLKKPGETASVKIFEVVDSGQYGGTPPITGPGYVGVRTDFMDVSFDNFKAVKI